MSASRAVRAAPVTPELDELTLQRAKRGERAAQRALVERYQTPVFALLSRMLPGRPRALVEDLAQDAFLKVFKGLTRFKPSERAKLSTWILTIASRVAIDHLRKEKVRARLHLVKEDASEQPDVVSAREIRERVHSAVDALTPEQRAVFVLQHFHGLSLEEIASAEDLKVGTVKSRLSRAKEQLRAALREFMEDSR